MASIYDPPRGSCHLTAVLAVRQAHPPLPRLPHRHQWYSVAPPSALGPPGGIGPVAHRVRSIGLVAHRANTSLARPLVILVANYDSFTWNLAHLMDTAGWGTAA
jgi:hypothetical protein